MYSLANVHVMLQWQYGRLDQELHFPEEFRDLVDQCLSKDPAARPTMRQVVERLQDVPLTGNSLCQHLHLAQYQASYGQGRIQKQSDLGCCVCMPTISHPLFESPAIPLLHPTVCALLV